MREGALWVRGFVATPDGKRMAHAELTGPATEPEALGLRLAADLRAQGADAILASLPGSP
jgi:hydroxymethylbilane synthase